MICSSVNRLCLIACPPSGFYTPENSHFNWYSFRGAGQGNAATEDLGHGIRKSFSFALMPSVIAESLFVKVAEQMERFDADVGSMNTTLQERPEVFHGVSVNGPVHVGDRVVNNLVRVLASQSVIGTEIVAVEGGSGLYMLSH